MEEIVNRELSQQAGDATLAELVACYVDACIRHSGVWCVVV